MSWLCPEAVGGVSMCPEAVGGVSMCPEAVGGVSMCPEAVGGVSMCRQVAVKNNIDVFYLSMTIPLHVLFSEDGEMEKKDFLQLWKEISSASEVQHVIAQVQHNAGRR